MWTLTTPRWPSTASRRTSGAVFACVVLTAALACSRSDRPGTGDVDAFPALTAAEDLRIGDVDDPDLGFSRIGGVDVDRDGQVFVYEAMDRQIRVYDSEGRPVRRIGRQGEGPGEFGWVARLGVVGDTVWVCDAPEGININVVQRTIRQAMDWPEFQLPVDSAPSGHDGTLWLRLSDDGGPALRYLVLDGDGNARGVFVVPRRFQVRWISGDEFWAVDTDELGVPWLVRFRYGTP
jgi:hypothetical protein